MQNLIKCILYCIALIAINTPHLAMGQGNNTSTKKNKNTTGVKPLAWIVSYDSDLIYLNIPEKNGELSEPWHEIKRGEDLSKEMLKSVNWNSLCSVRGRNGSFRTSDFLYYVKSRCDTSNNAPEGRSLPQRCEEGASTKISGMEFVPYHALTLECENGEIKECLKNIKTEKELVGALSKSGSTEPTRAKPKPIEGEFVGSKERQNSEEESSIRLSFFLSILLAFGIGMFLGLAIPRLSDVQRAYRDRARTHKRRGRANQSTISTDVSVPTLAPNLSNILMLIKRIDERIPTNLESIVNPVSAPGKRTREKELAKLQAQVEEYRDEKRVREKDWKKLQRAVERILLELTGQPSEIWENKPGDLADRLLKELNQNQSKLSPFKGVIASLEDISRNTRSLQLQIQENVGLGRRFDEGIRQTLADIAKFGDELANKYKEDPILREVPNSSQYREHEAKIKDKFIKKLSQPLCALEKWIFLGAGILELKKSSEGHWLSAMEELSDELHTIFEGIGVRFHKVGYLDDFDDRRHVKKGDFEYREIEIAEQAVRQHYMDGRLHDGMILGFSSLGYNYRNVDAERSEVIVFDGKSPLEFLQS